MRRFLLMLIPTAALLTGCGSASPTSPIAGAATIAGAIVGPGSSSTSPGGGPSVAAPSAGMTVSIVGSNQSTTVDANDNFTLTNVRPGDVSLKFSGAGVNSQVALGTIEASDHVSVTIVRDGASVSLDCINRVGAGREELEGRIDGLPPTTPAGTFTISGQSVQTDAKTTFTKGGRPATFADLQIGMRVHVEGTPNATGVLAASVIIQDTNVDLTVVLEGALSNLSGTATAFQFMLGNRLIKGDTTTVFDAGITFADLASGVHVEVHGTIQAGYIQATKIELEASAP